jgi:hypothetical protein
MSAAAWDAHPLSRTLADLESKIGGKHPREGMPPVTAEEMAYALAGEDLARPPNGVCVLPDYAPVHPPKPAPTLVSAIGDQGMVGSNLRSSLEFLHPPKSSPAPVQEVVFWARKWESKQWIARDEKAFQGKRVWLKLWGLPGLLLQP